MTKINISLIKADVGGFPDHSSVHPRKTAREKEDLRKIKIALALITIAQMIGIAWAMQDLRSIHSLQIAILTTALRVLV